MPHRLISITSPEYGKIPMTLLQTTTDQNVTVLETKQPFGVIRWTITEYKKFKLWHATYRIKHPIHLKISVNKPYLGFIFALKNDIKHYHLKGLNPMAILEHQYDLFYTPSIQLEYQFEPETYVLCGFDFKTSSFKPWSKIFTPLQAFYSSANNNAPLRLKNDPITSTPRVLASLFHILQCQYTGNKKKKFLGFKTSELTFYALQDTISINNNPLIHSSEVQKMMEVKDYLLNNLNTPGTIHQIALLFGLNDFKLKQTFKRIFGTSIYAFILEERLQNAQISILETDIPLNQIAQQAGYSDLSAFSNAFKSRFGIRPSVLRKRNP
ncbi:MAG: AraC family transcriptional regulator [Marinoscillum sp.]